MVKVYYNGTTLVNGDYVYGLRYRYKTYSDEFKIGATPCREVFIQIDKQAYATHPEFFTLTEDSTGTEQNICKVYVDNVDDTNDYYYSYTCLDAMVFLNVEMEFTEDTVYNLVRGILSKHGLPTDVTGITNTATPGSLRVTWSDYCTEREFIGYVAERLGRYAYFNSTGSLRFMTYNKTDSWTLQPDDIADLTVGAEHNYTRVVWDSVAHYEYGNTNGETLYLNTDNILFTDSDTISIQDQVNNIGKAILGNAPDAVNFGLKFWNLKVSQAVIPNNAVIGSPTRRIAVNNGTTTYSTWLEPDYSYNNGYWHGGIDTELKTAEQEETQVVNTETKRAINSVNTRIDRQAGIIDLYGQRITTAEGQIEESNIHFQVDSAKSEVRVTNENTYTPDAYTSFKGDGMRVYVEGEQVAEATANRFNCDKGLGVQDWAIEHGEDPKVLMIYRLR